MKPFPLLLATVFLAFLWLSPVRAEDGYRLWLRYDLIQDETRRSTLRAALQEVIFITPKGEDSPTLQAARRELAEGLCGLLGIDIPTSQRANPALAGTGHSEGYTLRWLSSTDHTRSTPLGPRGLKASDSSTATTGAGGVVTLSSASDQGILYGAFALLRHLQTGGLPSDREQHSQPAIQRRMLNHWDDLNRFVERGYAGFSLWDWFTLPEVRLPRYRDYARACASLGLNGTVLTNVNANAWILTPEYLRKVAALAEEFRPYGVRVYLTARFSAPLEIGGLKTADPLNAEVVAWWRKKVDEIYTFIPDFGGFVVKANSEGQPGPQDYGRTHAEGANLLADALAPHQGIVMWRAFVYQAANTEDRVNQAYREFMPLDGQFRDNVVLQIKNGPLDFMPREPFHPLFGGLRKTVPALELQITQEYLGASIHLCYLAPLFEEVLDADTYANGAGSTLARVVDGSLHRHTLSAIMGVANTGTDRNWTGHPLAQANWYAFGRLAWDPALSSEAIAREWVRQTFSPADEATCESIFRILMPSREIVVNYSMPLGLHHIMAEGHHFGPGPWVVSSRPDWSSPYYHQADTQGLGANRGTTGSNAVATYAKELSERWGNPDTCPENLLLWFHHVAWTHTMPSGRSLWDELCLRYQSGVDGVRSLQRQWSALKGKIDEERFLHVSALLKRQESDACDWRDACLLYFQQFSKMPLPPGVEEPRASLEAFKAVKLRYFPGNPGGH